MQVCVIEKNIANIDAVEIDAYIKQLKSSFDWTNHCVQGGAHHFVFLEKDEKKRSTKNMVKNLKDYKRACFPGNHITAAVVGKQFSVVNEGGEEMLYNKRELQEIFFKGQEDFNEFGSQNLGGGQKIVFTDVETNGGER